VPLVLSTGQQTKGLLFKLAPNAIISGRVLDSEGDPMGSVMVLALRPTYQRGERQWLPLGTVQTNDLGEFRIASLTAGGYVVAASSTLSVGSLLGGSDRSASDKPEMAYATTFYPNAADASGAMGVRVEVGGETKLGDIRLLRTPTVRVSGKFVGETEGRSFMVRLVPKGGGLLSSLAGKTAIVQPGGSFTLRGVAPGSYTLSSPSYSLNGVSSDSQAPLSGTQTIQVGDQNIEGILLQLSPGSELPGVVAVEGKDKVSLEKVQVQLNARDSSAGLGLPRGIPGEGGKFTLKNVAADRYLVQVNNLPEGSYVKSVRFGGQDLTEEGLDLTSGVAGSLQITLSLEAAQVDGVVQDSDNKPVAGATVVLLPDVRSRYSLYREVTADQNGAFRLKGVTPGDYKFLAWEDIVTGASQDPEFLKKYESKAESLSLKESGRRTLQVKAIPFEERR
jgi:hypothetical protein